MLNSFDVHNLMGCKDARLLFSHTPILQNRFQSLFKGYGLGILNDSFGLRYIFTDNNASSPDELIYWFTTLSTDIRKANSLYWWIK